MLEPLIYAMCVVFALIGLVTVIYGIVIRIVLKASDIKCSVVLISSDNNPELLYACKNVLKSHPLFSPKFIKIVLKSPKSDQDG